MDSGNSSSMQSSSGGGGDQEEYDSRADLSSISAFFNTTTVSSNIAVPTQLDSLIANYFNTGWSMDNPLWSTDGSSTRPPPPPMISSEPVFFTNPLQQNLRTVSNTTSPICSVPTDNKNCLNNISTTRNPKKRSRVSRRAPTTVLTTDTSNFRAMVQEFTGNPSTPFTGLSSSYPFPKSRFDLFASSSSSSPSRPLKHFPHKLTPHHIPSPSDYHQQSLLNMNTQNITNPFLNNQSSNNPLMDQSILCEKSKPLFEGLHNIFVASSMTQPTLDIIHGDKNSEEGDNNDMLRSINGDQSTVQRSTGFTPPAASGSENNLRNEGMVGLSWNSSSD